MYLYYMLYFYGPPEDIIYTISCLVYPFLYPIFSLSSLLFNFARLASSFFFYYQILNLLNQKFLEHIS